MIKDKLNKLEYEKDSKLHKLVQDLEKLELTLEDGNLIGTLIWDRYHEVKTELEDFCSKCYNKSISGRHYMPKSKKKKEELQKYKDKLSKLNHLFWKFTKYDYESYKINWKK